MKGDRAYQAHESDPMRKFRFRKHFGLQKYNNLKRPLVVFGVYSRRDVRVIVSHRAPVIIVWMGSDAIGALVKSARMPKVIHTTWIPAIQAKLESLGLKCTLLKVPVKELESPPVLTRGEHIYTYLQKSKPDYHGKEIIDQWDTDIPIKIGDHSIPRIEWEQGENNKFYSECFCGLFLSKFAGGAMGILEMGVRGIPVITNVLDLPHCIHWKTKEDIEEKIIELSELAGTKDEELAQSVKDALYKVPGYFDVSEMKR
jgi:hypothetical protein